MSWTNTQKSALTIAAITSFLNPFLISAVNVALPSIEKAFSMDAVTLSWVITSYLLSSAVLLLPMGKMADMRGIKKIFTIGVVIFSITTFLCGISSSGTMLIIFRVIQGIGGSMTMTTAPAILVMAFPQEQRGRVLGISVSAVYMGLATGPFVGGILTQQLGWRSVFIISSLFGLFAAIITFLFLGKDKKEKVLAPIDIPGSTIYALALMALVFGSSKIPETTGWLLLATGALLLAAFVFVENRSENPVIDLRLFSKNRLFAFSNIAALINYSATFAIVFLLSLYLQKIQLLSPQKAGTILLAQPLVMAILSPIAGQWSDRIQPRYLSSLGMALSAIGLLWMVFLNKETSHTVIVFNLILVGLGFALFSSPNMNTIMSSVNKDQYAIASGVSSSMRVVGQIVSMTIVTFFMAWFLGKSSIMEVSNDLFMNSVKWAFSAFSLLAFIGVYFSMARGNIQRAK